MTDNQVYDDMAQHTLTQGGGTFARDAYRGADLPNRYIVALGEPWANVVDTTQDNPHYVAWDIASALRVLANSTGPWQNTTAGAIGHNPRALGTWLDNVGYVHIDVVESYSHRGYALRLAREHGQDAIWDSVDRVAINVPTDTVAERLEYLRGEIQSERISYGEIAELQGLAEHIDSGDVELLEWAGVPEHG